MTDSTCWYSWSASEWRHNWIVMVPQTICTGAVLVRDGILNSSSRCWAVCHYCYTNSRHHIHLKHIILNFLRARQNIFIKSLDTGWTYGKHHETITSIEVSELKVVSNNVFRTLQACLERHAVRILWWSVFQTTYFANAVRDSSSRHVIRDATHHSLRIWWRHHGRTRWPQVIWLRSSTMTL
jgi:hypothetical protein